MSTLHFRQYDHVGQQNLYEELSDEMIHIYGVQAFYIPRRRMNTDLVMPDDKLSKFYNAYSIQTYINNVMGFGGQGDFLTKFGLELRDQISFVISPRDFYTRVVQQDASFMYDQSAYLGKPIIRPREGDVIYLPLNQKLFQIRFVEHEAPFYQFGQIQMFELRSELYAPNNELFGTGVPEIDALFARYNSPTELPLIPSDQPPNSTTLDEINYKGNREDQNADIEEVINKDGFMNFNEKDPFGDNS